MLLNTYYCQMPGLRPPEAIWLFSTSIVGWVARPVSRLFGDLVFRRMYHWQVGRFFSDPKVREQFLPLLYRQFTARRRLATDQRHHGAACSTSCCRPRSCSCWTGPATTCSSTNHSRSPG